MQTIRRNVELETKLIDDLLDLTGDGVSDIDPTKIQSIPFRMFRLSEDWTINDHTINHFSVGYNRFANFNGQPIYLKDIATVTDSVEEPRSLSRLDGENAVTLVVRKQSGSNTVKLIAAVKQRLEELKPILPPDFKLTVIRDQSIFINRSLHEISFHLMLGAVLVALTVFFFLHDWRGTLIASVAIPASLVATFTLMRSMGYTLNNFTMLGMVFAVGIVIDDAIIVLENIFRCVNIALMNELLQVSERMDVDIWEVVDAAKTKPFGFMPFYPGPGLGGHCIPLDPFYLTWKAAEHGAWARFIELAGEINARMPQWVVHKTMLALNGQGKALRGARVLVLGLSYKANIDDDRESPSYELLELLDEHGAKVAFCDPHFPVARKGRKHALELPSVPCSAESFASYDALVVSTAHDAFKDAALYKDMRLVVDTRNIMAPLFAGRRGGPTVVKA